MGCYCGFEIGGSPGVGTLVLTSAPLPPLFFCNFSGRGLGVCLGVGGEAAREGAWP